MTMLNTLRDEMCYCPGCSHGLVLERLGEAINRLGLPPENVCIVSDIGCIGTADRYFGCHTFHGLHGRSFTYAEGIRRQRPDLLTIVLVGDGGCGIGTAHLVHGARRGVPIKVIVCNNFNFGMTGGQASPTTPTDAFTPTSPAGCHERPFDIAGTARVAGASFVARGSAHDPRLADLLETALREPGFALVDIWELCAAYFVPANKVNPARLPELATQIGLPFGVWKWDEPTHAARTPTGASLARAERLGPAAPAAIESPESSPRLPWARRTEICIAGSAGQHIRSAAGVLGDIAVASGLFAAEHDDYPITVRKGHSISNLIVDSKPILYAGLDHPDLLIVLSTDGAGRLGSFAALPTSCTVWMESSLTAATTPATVRPFELVALIKVAPRAGAALAILAGAVVEQGWITEENLLAAARAVLRGPHRDSNLKAMQAGVAFARQAVSASLGGPQGRAGGAS